MNNREYGIILLIRFINLQGSNRDIQELFLFDRHND